MKLNILYEDNHIIVAIKPAGILSQADHTNAPDMLSILKEYIKNKYHKEGNVYLGLVQRLDRNTSGIMVFARTSKAASRLSEQIRNHDVFKKYLAVIEGIPQKEQTLSNYLKKDEKLVKSFVTTEKNGKLAVLDYQLIASINNYSLINVLLHTGRHHQIRVQMANINHPLVGDHLYGSKINCKYHLHAYYLTFVHPISKEVMKFTNLPENGLWNLFDMSKL